MTKRKTPHRIFRQKQTKGLDAQICSTRRHSDADGIHRRMLEEMRKAGAQQEVRRPRAYEELPRHFSVQDIVNPLPNCSEP